MTKRTQKALDEIYGGPPADFIKGRDALAKALHTEGDEEAASEVKALRKPSKAAAVVNALALDDRKPVKRYLGLAEKLRRATSGKVDAKRMRELAREEGELLEELVARAGKLGSGTSASTLDRVRETLQAAQVDAALGEKLMAGRVEREQRAASVGLDNLAQTPRAPKRKSTSKRQAKGAAKTKTERAAKAERKRREEAKAALTDAKAEAREAAREVARAESALAKAERARDSADGKVERAEAKLSRL